MTSEILPQVSNLDPLPLVQPDAIPLYLSGSLFLGGITAICLAIDVLSTRYLSRFYYLVLGARVVAVAVTALVYLVGYTLALLWIRCFLYAARKFGRQVAGGAIIILCAVILPMFGGTLAAMAFATHMTVHITFIWMTLNAPKPWKFFTDPFLSRMDPWVETGYWVDPAVRNIARLRDLQVERDAVTLLQRPEPAPLDSQDGVETSFVQTILDAVPGASDFVKAHPLLSTVFASTWLIRSYYAVRHVPGLIASMTEVIMLAGLSIDPAILDRLLHTLYKSIGISPELNLDSQGDGDPVSVHVTDVAYNLVNGLLGFGMDKRIEARMKTQALMAGRVKDLAGFVTFAVTLLRSIVQYVRFAVYGLTESERLGVLVAEFAARSSEFATLDMKTVTRPRAEALIKLYEIGLKLRALQMQWPDAIKKEFLIPMTNVLREGKEVYHDLVEIARHAGSRPEPTVVAFYGDPSAMKSAIMSLFAKFAVIKLNGSLDESLIYALNPELDHMDGFRSSTRVVTVDDYLQQTDETSVSNQVRFMFNAVNHTEYQVKMASLNDKGLKYTAPVLLLSSNYDLSSLCAGREKGVDDKRSKLSFAITSPPAFARRHQTVYHVSVTDPKLRADLLTGVAPMTLDNLEKAFALRLRGRIEGPDLVYADEPITITAAIGAMSQEIDARYNRKVRFSEGLDKIASSLAGVKPPTEEKAVSPVSQVETLMEEVALLGGRAFARVTGIADDLSTLTRSAAKEAEFSTRLWAWSTFAPQSPPTFLDSCRPPQPLEECAPYDLLEKLLTYEYCAGRSPLKLKRSDMELIVDCWNIDGHDITLPSHPSTSAPTEPLVSQADPETEEEIDWFAVTDEFGDPTDEWYDRGLWWESPPPSPIRDYEEFDSQSGPLKMTRRQKRRWERAQGSRARSPYGDIRIVEGVGPRPKRKLRTRDIKELRWAPLDSQSWTDDLTGMVFWHLAPSWLRKFRDFVSHHAGTLAASVTALWTLVLGGVIGVPTAVVSGVVFAASLAYRRFRQAKASTVMSIVIVVVVLLVLVGFIVYSRSTAPDAVTFQYDTSERKAASSARPLKTHAITRGLSPKGPEPVKSQAGPDPNCSAIIDGLLKTSFGRIAVTAPGRPTTASNLFCVGNSTAWVPQHMWDKAQAHGAMLTITLPNVTKVFRPEEFAEVGFVEGSDLVFLQHPFFAGKDRRKYFMTAAELDQALTIGAECFMLTYSSGTIGVPFFRRVSDPTWSSTNLKGTEAFVTTPHIRGGSDTQDGDCGGILFFQDNRLHGGRLCGSLFGTTPERGKDQKSFFTVVTREDLDQLFPPSHENMDSQFLEDPLDVCREAPRPILEGVRYHGVPAQVPYQSPKSDISPSLIASHILHEFGAPSTHPTRCTRNLEGARYGLNKWKRARPDVNWRDIQALIGDVWQTWPAPSGEGILSLVESVEGSPILNMSPVRQASGPGYGFKGKSGKYPFLIRHSSEEPREVSPTLMDALRDVIYDAAAGSGLRPSEVYQKSERSEKADLENRLTHGVRLNDQLVERSIFGEWLDMGRRQCPEGPSMVGFDPYSMHWELMERYGMFSKKLSLDTSGWDVSVPRGVLIYVCRQILLWYRHHRNDGLNWLRADYLLHTVIYHVHALQNVWISRDGVSSGSIFTTEINNTVNEVISKVIFYRAFLDAGLTPAQARDLEDTGVRKFFMGDDSRIYVSDDVAEIVTNRTYAEYAYKIFGFVMTPSHDKTASLDDWPTPEQATFLKRHTVRLDGVRFGAFPKKGCVEIARWITSGLDPKEATRDNCEASLREMAFYGRDEFEKLKSFYSAALARTRCPPIRLTYDDWRDMVYKSVPSPVTKSLRYLKQVTNSPHGCSGLQSSPEANQSEGRGKEEERNLLESGVRLLNSKGFPIDVQVVLGLLAEKRTCDLLPTEVKVQPIRPIFTVAHAKASRVGSNSQTPEELVQPLHSQSAPLREVQTLPVTVRVETQTTTDETMDVSVSSPNQAPLTELKATSTLPDQGMSQVLSRPYELVNVAWASTDAVGTTLAELNFPGMLFSIPQIEEKLKWFTYFRCSAIKLTIRMNLTPFHYGALALSSVEGQQEWGRWPHDGEFQQRLNNRPTFLTAMTSPVSEVTLPWTLPWPWLPILLVNGGNYGGAPPNYNALPLQGIVQRVHLDVVQPLSMLGTSVTPGTISIFANFVDPEVQGPILATDPIPPPSEPLVSQSGVDPEAEAKGKSGISSVAEGIGALTQTLEAVTLAASKFGALAALDKPTIPLNPQPIIPSSYLSMPNTDASFIGTPLSAKFGARLATEGVYKEGTPSLLSVASTPGVVQFFTVEGGTMTAGDLVTRWYVHPCFSENLVAGPPALEMVPTYMQHVAAGFRWWRGSLRYQIRLFCPKFATARFRAVWFPPDKGVASIPPSTLASSDVGNLYSRVFDVTGDTIVDFLVPWLSPTTYRSTNPKNALPTVDFDQAYLGSTFAGLSTGTSNGSIAIYVVNDIAAPSTTVPVNITTVVYGAAGPDFQVSFYEGIADWAPGVEAENVPEELISQSGPVWESFKESSDPIAPSSGYLDHKLTAPEEYHAYTDLLKRFEYKGQSSLTLNLWPFPWNFFGINNGPLVSPMSGLAYWMRPFVWARGGIRYINAPSTTTRSLRATPTGVVAADLLWTGAPSVAGMAFNVAQVPLEFYPYVPFPYWPLNADLGNPNGADAYYPLTTIGIEENYEWGPQLVAGGGLDRWIAMTDDFQLFGLYCPNPLYFGDPQALLSRTVRRRRFGRVRTRLRFKRPLVEVKDDYDPKGKKRAAPGDPDA